MAEVQKNTESGETAQRFIEFVMMQAQSTMFYLGQIPNPQTGQPVEPNLVVAKMYIDQLAMIREKTRGNLSTEETEMMGGILSDLQMAFVEISNRAGAGHPAPFSAAAVQEPEAIPTPATPTPEQPAAAIAQEPAPSAEESKKKFSKSYGS